MLDILFLLSGTVLAISFLLHSATKGEIQKDNELQRLPTQKMLNMRRITGQVMGVSGAILLFAFAFNFATPPRESDISKNTAVEANETDTPVDYYEMARTAKDLHTLRKAFQEIEPDVLDVRFKNDIVIIEYDPDSEFWNETTLMKDFANSSTKLLTAMDGSVHYKSFAFERKGSLIDDKGNEETKDMIRVLYLGHSIHQINFENYPDVVSLNPYKFYMNATGYGIYGALYMNTKSEIRSNMPGFKDPETDRYDVYDFGGTVPSTESNLEESEDNYYVEDSTIEDGEPIINEETPEALQSAENVILGFMELTEEIRTIVDSVYVSMDADHVAADYALVIIESTREQAVIATNSFNHPKGVEELEVAITKLDSLKAKLLEYNKMQEAPGWDFDRYDEVLMHVDTFYEDLDFNPVTVKQLLEVYGY